jgi:hypothetical protein
MTNGLSSFILGASGAAPTRPLVHKIMHRGILIVSLPGSLQNRLS